MDNQTKTIYKSMGRYSLWTAIAGVFCYLSFFPDGIYYSFFCGVMAVAAAIISKKHVRGGGSTAGLILGFIDAAIGLLAFYGMYIVYDAANDPVMGPRVIEFLTNILSQNGISLDAYTQMVGR